jgi:outer membrane protein TolC
MKTLIKLILILFVSGFLHAQQRNLNFYVEQATINSPLINKNKNENNIVSLDLKQVKSILSKPEINVEVNVLFAPIVSHDNNTNRFEWTSPGATNYTGYDLAITDGGQYQAFVSIRQPLLTASKFRSFSNKSDISSQINENTIALTMHELVQLVNYQYILCLKSKAQSENSLIILKEMDKQLLIMQKLVESAIYRQTDLMLLQIEHQNFEGEFKTYQAEFRSNLYDLNLICGINDTSLIDIQETNFQLNSDKDVHSRFLISYRLDSLSIAADQAIYELKYKPQLNVFANAGLNAVYQPAFNRFGFSTGVALIWNIYDGNLRKFQRDKSAINLKTLDFEKNHFLIQNNLNKNKILNQIQSLNQRENLSSKQLIQYYKLYDVYTMELAQGEISVMDFKNLMKDIAAKKQESLQLKMERQLLISSFNYWNY